MHRDNVRGPYAVDEGGNFGGFHTLFRQITQRTRGEMLRAVVNTIATAVADHQIAAHEIAIIAPGLDNIARYTLTDALAQHRIPVVSLNNQRPLHSSPSIRSIRRP